MSVIADAFQRARETPSPVHPDRPVMLVHLIRKGDRIIGPELAGRVIAEASFERQRKISAKHVAALSDLVLNGNFEPGTQITFARLGDALHLVNGHHRMHAVVKAGKPVEFSVRIVDVNTPEEIAVLYYHQDRVARPRSTREVVDAVGVADKFGISRQTACAAMEAIGLIIGGWVFSPGARTAISDDARLNALAAYWPSVGLIESAITRAPTPVKRRLLSVGAFAVEMMIARYQPRAADLFLRQIAEDDGLRKGDPEHTLLRDMQQRNWSGSASIGARVLATAWNAYVGNRKIQLIRIYPDSAFEICGTPVKKR